MEMFMNAEFWVAVGQIIMIDILLGGDNAVVIALACRKLPPAQRTSGAQSRLYTEPQRRTRGTHSWKCSQAPSSGSPSARSS